MDNCPGSLAEKNPSGFLSTMKYCDLYEFFFGVMQRPCAPRRTVNDNKQKQILSVSITMLQ